MMLKVDIHRARTGMKLALPVSNPKLPARNLLRVGYELNDQVVGKLEGLGIRSLWVQYPSLAFLERFLDRRGVESRQRVVHTIADTFEMMQHHSSAKLAYDTYTKSIGQLVDELIGHPQTAVFLGDLSESADDLLRHSATVTYLSVLLGLKLEGYLVRERRHVDPGKAKEVTNLGLGAMLHDLGVTLLDASVRERYERTGDESDPMWREHPAMGYREVRGKISASAATVVLNHHQRFDGSGFAGRGFPALDDKRIHVFARICAVADQFDRMRNPPGLPSQPTVWVLASMLSDPVARQFDPEVLRALLDVVPPYPPGSLVLLSDGRWAVCVDHNRHNPCRPVVQIVGDLDSAGVDAAEAGETIDLSEQSRRLYIRECEGHEVGDLNFDPGEVAAEVAAQG